MLRALVAVPSIALYTSLGGTASVLAGLVDRSGRLARSIARLWGRLLLQACGIRVRVTGEENIPPGPAVYAANHASAMDIPIVFGHLPVDFRIIHKQSLYRTPFVGWSLYFGRHIAIDRENPFKARKSLVTATELVRRGASLLIFPEGTRSPDGTVRAFKRGSFLLALEAGVPLVPVSIVGVKRVVPRGFLSLRPGTVLVRVHLPVPTAGRAVEEASALAREVRAIVVRGCEEAAS